MNEKRKVCYIAGAGNAQNVSFRPTMDDLVIAADGGFDLLERLKIRSDYIIGDFDSIRNLPKPSASVIQVPTEKDDTDMMLAVKFALAQGCRTVVIYGGLGDRLDHTLGNIQALVYLSRNHANGFLVGMGAVATAITDQSLQIEGMEHGVLSVFSHNLQSTGVTLKGLKYPLQEATLRNDDPLGVSNEFIGEPVLIRVKDGTLIVVWNEDKFSLSKIMISPNA